MKRTSLIALMGMILIAGCASQDQMSGMNHRLAMAERRNSDAELKYSEFDKRLKEIERVTSGFGSKTEEERRSQEERIQEIQSQFAGLRVNQDNLRQELAYLRGKVEEIDHALKQGMKENGDPGKKTTQQMESLESAVRSQQERIGKIEQYLSLETTAKPDEKQGAPAALRTEMSEDELYTSAKGSFDKGDFEAARQGFQKLLQRFGNSKNADNAQFWIGDSYYREKWYEKAILEYQKVIENYPKGNKVPAALLKQALSFINLGDKANARLILKELEKKHPETNEGQIAKKKLETVN